MDPSRRLVLKAASLGVAALSGARALAFGEAGAFNPRLLTGGARQPLAGRETGASRWSWELVRRTSAPARLVVSRVAADRPDLCAEPFAIWAGSTDAGTLSASELRGLSRFFALGGLLVVDDSDPENGVFGRSARRELARVLPESPPVRLDPSHVLFKTYYIIDRPVGRALGSGSVEAIVRGKAAQAIFLDIDLLGALARGGDSWAFDVAGGYAHREQAARLAVNIAMYVLCSDYKDDQVHAPWLMRRRAGLRR
ncbi:MAG TPA: DUF4159 domain-containing protein [Polyangiaceae bacterium]|nr:DUF4159 domain-containing protein [Polyangiaceae bacterium]